MNKKIAGIILASGKSERMGQNKLLMDISNKPIIKHTLDRIKNIDIDLILVTCHDEIIDISKEYDLIIVENKKDNKGKQTSVKLGVTHGKGYEGLLFLQADQPFISNKTIQGMLDLFENKSDIISLLYENTRYSPTLFGSDYYKELKKLSNDQGGKELIEIYKDNVKFYKTKSELDIIDIDEIEDINYANKILKSEK